jgi:hypothetical protein
MKYLILALLFVGCSMQPRVVEKVVYKRHRKAKVVETKFTTRGVKFINCVEKFIKLDRTSAEADTTCIKAWGELK